MADDIDQAQMKAKVILPRDIQTVFEGKRPMSISNKYAELPGPRVEQEKVAPQSGPSSTDNQAQPIASKEHTRPLIPVVTYVTDMVTDSLVRIYDKGIAPREEAYCVARQDVEGRTPEQLRAFFALTFVPRFICDVRIPVGNTVTFCKLVNDSGQTARIYFPRTSLEFFNERPL